jgi:hypothetical protein
VCGPFAPTSRWPESFVKARSPPEGGTCLARGGVCTGSATIAARDKQPRHSASRESAFSAGIDGSVGYAPSLGIAAIARLKCVFARFILWPFLPCPEQTAASPMSGSACGQEKAPRCAGPSLEDRGMPLVPKAKAVMSQLVAFSDRQYHRFDRDARGDNCSSCD